MSHPGAETASTATADRETARPSLGRRLRRVAVLLAANLAGFLALVALAESVAGFWVHLESDAIVPSWRLNHTWKPSSTFEFRDLGRRAVNGQGWLRDEEVEKEKPADLFRVFYVGDSFVESPVPPEASLPARVERGLRAAAGGRKRVEVINTGTLSYSPTIEYVLTRYVLLDYHPDLIVVVVDMTDDYDDWKYRQVAVLDDEGNPKAVPPRNLLLTPWVDSRTGAIAAGPLDRLELLLLRYSRLYALARRFAPGREAALEQSREDDGGDLYGRWAWCREEWGPETTRNAGWTLDLLRRLARLCREHGISLVLTSAPHYPQFAGELDGSGAPLWSDRPHREIAAVAASEGVPYLDALTALAPRIAGSPQDRFYRPKDMHFNVDGYEAWAAVHLAFLLDPTHHLLPSELYSEGGP